MSKPKDEVMIIVSKDLRARIKVAAAKARKRMRDYLDSIVPKE